MVNVNDILNQISELSDDDRLEVLEALQEYVAVELFNKDWELGTGIWRNSFVVEVFSDHPLDADSTLLDLYKEVESGSSTGWVQNASIFEVSSDSMFRMLLERTTDADVEGWPDDPPENGFTRPAW